MNTKEDNQDIQIFKKELWVQRIITEDKTPIILLSSLINSTRGTIG